MKRILICWIGNTDLLASEGENVGVGPIAQALDTREFDEVFFITDYEATRVKPYLNWIKERAPTPHQLFYRQLSSPTHFGEIYEIAASICQEALDQYGDQTELTFHLSPGTPAMAAVWIILAKTRFPAELIESSRAYGVQTASVPFDISAEFLPTLLQKPDAQLRSLSEEKPTESANFENIIYRSPAIARVVEKAKRVAVRNIPVLFEGESGTGKELFAGAIHQRSLRKGEFIPVNCGAIHPNLVESELFGHKKGAFSNAYEDREGHFEQANKGTIFLDEIGELPKDIQVTLLRVLDKKEVVRVGESKPRKVDVRIVAATNRNLIEEVSEGRFREDLFYRLAVAYLKLPPLREREGDMGLLIDHSLERINQENEAQPGYKHKKISAGARNLILNYHWPGNIRELQNTLRRAMVWTDGEILTRQDIEEALLPPFGKRDKDILNRPLDAGFSLPNLIDEVAKHYLNRALKEAKTKKEAAELVGLPSYQTLTNWAKKHGVGIHKKRK
ncbi:MAG: sigma 54-interacting transcriptional regulator [Gemmatimonadota bacterium]|nr:sigma 54-interacting transcriptional regulator [Gemmatimonadota bacterium]